MWHINLKFYTCINHIIISEEFENKHLWPADHIVKLLSKSLDLLNKYVFVIVPQHLLHRKQDFFNFSVVTLHSEIKY